MSRTCGDLETVLNEIRRVLKPGGVFLFDTIHRSWLATLVVVILGEYILRLLPIGPRSKTLHQTFHLESALQERGFVMGKVGPWSKRD